MPLPQGIFVGAELHARPVALPDGSTGTFHFREVSSTEFRAFQIAEQSPDLEQRKRSMAVLVAASVIDPDTGALAMTAEQAGQLKPFVMNGLVREIVTLNKMGRDEKNE